MAGGVSQIDVIVADLDRYTAKEIVALAINIDAELRDSPPGGTPVDTGWARANWVPSVGSVKPIDGHSPEGVRKAGGPHGKPEFRSLANTEIAARAQIQAAGLNEVLGYNHGDGPIFITNNVPYIQALNAGHSTQSPPGFVQNAIAKGVKGTYSAGASKAARNRRADAGRAAKATPL